MDAKQVRRTKLEGMKRGSKDPGLPNLAFYKKKMIEQLEHKERQDDDTVRMAKLLRKKLCKETGQEVEEEKLEVVKDKGDIDDYMSHVKGTIMRYNEGIEENKKDEDEDFNDKKVGQSRKAYIKDLKAVVEQSDVVLEVLDARDPLGWRNIEIEHKVTALNKKLVLVLNKIDLVPKENARDWLKILRDEHPTVLFKSTTQAQRNNLAAKISLHKSSLTDRQEMVDTMLQGSKAIGTDNLLQLLKNYCRNDSSERKQKHAIIVGVIGFPNVGKSSLINSLKRSRAAATGNQPGFTKNIQQIYLDSDITLLDSPGVVLSKESSDSLILRNTIKVDDLDDPITPVEVMINKVSKNELVTLYEINEFNTTNEFLAAIARKTGKLSKGGIPDWNAAAKIVLHDWNNGKISYYTPVDGTKLSEINVEKHVDMDED